MDHRGGRHRNTDKLDMWSYLSWLPRVHQEAAESKFMSCKVKFSVSVSVQLLQAVCLFLLIHMNNYI